MTLPHNMLLRGLNSIILQAPHVNKLGDVKDFLFFCRAWVTMVEQHHKAEDDVYFPALKRVSGRPYLCESEKAQHEGLHEGLERLKAYIEETEGNVEKYKWEGEGGLKEVVDSFAGDFRQHLCDEIEMLLSLKDVDSDELLGAWEALKNHVKAMKMDNVFVSASSSLDTVYDMIKMLMARLGCDHADVHGLLR